jgi:hypothetical protein
MWIYENTNSGVFNKSIEVMGMWQEKRWLISKQILFRIFQNLRLLMRPPFRNMFICKTWNTLLDLHSSIILFDFMNCWILQETHSLLSFLSGPEKQTEIF